jgi:peptidyl-prolyl cis-trans isomerase C
VKPLTRLAVFLFFLVLSGLYDVQYQAAAQDAPAKASPPKQAQTPKPQAADDESIPPAAPDAIFPAIVARVNGKAISGRDLEDVVRRELSAIGDPEWNNLREDYRGQLTLNSINVLINSSLLYQSAVAAGIKATDEEVQAEFQKIAKSFSSDAEMNAALAKQGKDRSALEKNLKETLLMSKYVDENVNKKISVSQDDLAKYYSSNPKEFTHPDIVRTSHILIPPAGDTAEQDAKARERAEALLARIKKGEDFAKLAKENSVDASASQGGDIGFAAKEALASEYAEAAFSLPVGGVKLVKTRYGYHIIKVTEKKSAGLATLDEVKDQLTEFLKNQKAQADLTKLVNQLRDKAKIEILIAAGQPLTP